MDVFYREENFDTLYFATDFMQDNLNNFIRTKRLANNDIKLLVYQIIKALRYLHSVGIVHKVGKIK